ncbi:transcription factor of the MADS box [Orobanche gracilis]
MEKTTTKGRQKILIKPIEKESDRYATFSKRRLGLVRKASELSTLCNVDIGLVIYYRQSSVLQTPNQRSDNDGSRLIEAYTRTRISQLNRMLDKLGEDMEVEKGQEKELEVLKNGEGCGYRRGDWWNEPIDVFGKQEVEQIIGWLENLRAELISHLIEEMK